MRYFFVVLFVISQTGLFAQTITNVKTQRKNNTEKIKFILSDSLTNREYRIEVSTIRNGDSVAGVNISSAAQESNYNILYKPGFEKHYFVATNSGVTATPFGIKAGMIGNPGFYVGFRYGQGEVYRSESFGDIVSVPLYSATIGIIKPLLVTKSKDILAFQLGAGYGEWWTFRWERWSKSGYEIEAGLLYTHNNLLLSAGCSMLNGYQVYAAWDFTCGIGWKF